MTAIPTIPAAVLAAVIGGDYILEISGDFNKDELLNLAKSAKV